MMIFIDKYSCYEVLEDTTLNKGDVIAVPNSTKNIVFGNLGIIAAMAGGIYVGYKVRKKFVNKSEKKNDK